MAKHFLPELPREPAPLSAARPRRVFSRPAALFPAGSSSPEDSRLLMFSKQEIKSRDRGLSAMPEELVKLLAKTERRDLVEFLSTVQRRQNWLIAR